MNSAEGRLNVLDKEGTKREKKKKIFLCQEMKFFQYVSDMKLQKSSVLFRGNAAHKYFLTYKGHDF